MQSQDSIQVHIRIRSPPTSTLPSTPSSTAYLPHSSSTLQLNKTTFTFDQIHPPSTPQSTIFSSTGLKSITHALQGYNSCIFVYGQTGSGKTYTMIGGDGGIIQRSMEYLFYQIEEGEGVADANYVITCSYYEIYNEQLFDLLDHNEKKKLSIREDIKKGVFIEGLCEENIDTSGKGMTLLNQGIRSRHVAQTMMNRESSRSHTIFTLNIQSNNNKIIKTSKLHFVDLAGSQRQKTTFCNGDRLKQASNINKSLTTLGMVINSLSSSSSTKLPAHIPFRDSKLTFVLRDSLNGNSKTYLIATISSNMDYFQETLSTLKFAQRVKMVRLKAVRNEETVAGGVEGLKEEIRRLREENRNVMRDLERERGKGKGGDEGVMERYREDVEGINEKISCLVELLPKVMEECRDETKMGEINENLDGIIQLRQKIITKGTIENLKLQNPTPNDNKGVRAFKQTVTVWKNKVQQLNNQLLSTDHQNTQLSTKLTLHSKQILSLQQQNQILKYTLQTKEGKSSAETVKNLLKTKLNPEGCLNCKEADCFIMKMSNDIVGLKKELNGVRMEYQVLEEEHQFLKIGYKNLEEEGERRMKEMVGKKKEDGLLTCSINGKQVSVSTLTTRVRELQNINIDLTSQIQVLRQTIQFKDSQLQELKLSPLPLSSKQNITPLKDLTKLDNIPSPNSDWKSQSRETKILELQRQLRIHLQDLSSTKEEVVMLKRQKEENTRDDMVYSSLLEKISDEHENLVVATKVIEDELRRKIVGYERELQAKGEEIGRLNGFGLEQLREIKEMEEVIKGKQAKITELQEQYKTKLSLTQQQLSRTKTQFQALSKQLSQSKSLLDIYMNSIGSSEMNSQARTKQAQELRNLNHDLTLKNNRYEFLIKQREGDMLLLNNEIVSKRKEVVEYVEKFLVCQKQKEDIQKKLTEDTLKHEQQIVPLYQQNRKLKQLLQEKQTYYNPPERHNSPPHSSYSQSQPPHSPISHSASKAHRQEIDELKRLIKDRDRQYEDVYRLKKEADYKVYAEREEANRCIGGYMSEISLLKEKILYLETEGEEEGRRRGKLMMEIEELKRKIVI